MLSCHGKCFWYFGSSMDMPTHQASSESRSCNGHAEGHVVSAQHHKNPLSDLACLYLTNKMRTTILFLVPGVLKQFFQIYMKQVKTVHETPLLYDYSDIGYLQWQDKCLVNKHSWDLLIGDLREINFDLYYLHITCGMTRHLRLSFRGARIIAHVNDMLLAGFGAMVRLISVI